jgi:hypothetical protein
MREYDVLDQQRALTKGTAMAAEATSPDWIDLRVQHEWYKIRHELDKEIQGATAETRRDFGVVVRLNGASIRTDEGRSVLRVPVSATWQHKLEQTIANLIITAPEEDEPRMASIAHDVAELLQRWVEREVPVGASPDFFYPDRIARWPAQATPKGATAAAGDAASAPAG